jgi:hypothetical protein
MYQKVNEQWFVESFAVMNRKENFTRQGLGALFDYLTEHEESTGEQIELDVIAICCEFRELTTKELFEEYGDQVGAESAEWDALQWADHLSDDVEVIVVNDDRLILQN